MAAAAEKGEEAVATEMDWDWVEAVVGLSPASPAAPCSPLLRPSAPPKG